MVYQHGSPFYDEDEESCRVMHRKASHSFPISRVYQAHIPTCSSGYWLFGFASKKYHPLEHLNAKRWKERKIETWYYTTNLHKGAFMLPKYVEDIYEFNDCILPASSCCRPGRKHDVDFTDSYVCYHVFLYDSPAK